MSDDQWISELLSGIAGSSHHSPADTVVLGHIDLAILDRLGAVLDLDRASLSGTMRGVLRANGYDVPPFEIRTNTWRVDLPSAIVKTVIASTVGAAILQLGGVPAFPAALLGLIAPTLFEIRRVEIAAGDATLHLRLHAAVGTGPHGVAELHAKLPARIRDELTITEFTEVLDRLLGARLAVVGPDGIRLRAPTATRGFRLVLSSPPLTAELLTVTDPPEPAIAGRPRGVHATGVGFPRIFISYAHDTPAHKTAVASFADFLVDCGVDVRLDQYVPPQRHDWQQWATQEILNADYVLVIASPMCRRVGDGDIDPALHLGLQAEMRTLRDLYASDYPTWLRRTLPVVLPGGSVRDIPLFLQPRNADHYRIASLDKPGTDWLMRTLLTR